MNGVERQGFVIHAAQDNDGHLLGLRFDGVERVHPRTVRQRQVQQNHVHSPLFQSRQALFQVLGRFHLEADAAGLVQCPVQEMNIIGVVLDEQHFDRFRFHVLRGSTRIKSFLPLLSNGVKSLLRPQEPAQD